MYIEAQSDKLRKNLRDYIDHVMATGDRVLITRHGKEMVALVSAKDFEALEQVAKNREMFLENRHDAKMQEFRAMKAALEGSGNT